MWARPDARAPNGATVERVNADGCWQRDGAPPLTRPARPAPRRRPCRMPCRAPARAAGREGSHAPDGDDAPADPRLTTTKPGTTTATRHERARDEGGDMDLGRQADGELLQRALDGEPVVRARHPRARRGAPRRPVRRPGGPRPARRVRLRPAGPAAPDDAAAVAPVVRPSPRRRHARNGWHRVGAARRGQAAEVVAAAAAASSSRWRPSGSRPARPCPATPSTASSSCSTGSRSSWRVRASTRA